MQITEADQLAHELEKNPAIFSTNPHIFLHDSCSDDCIVQSPCCWAIGCSYLASNAHVCMFPVSWICMFDCLRMFTHTCMRLCNVFVCARVCVCVHIEEPQTEALNATCMCTSRKLAIRWHPDKNAGNDEATARFQDINNAYEYMCAEHGVICR
jgi:hypothetical protein